jgi:exodeoxyribonuclease-3
LRAREPQLNIGDVKLLSWNVNGMRAAGRAGFVDWLARERPFAVCVQEIKARPDDLDERLRNPRRYHAFWHPAERPGYSGVATFTRSEPLGVVNGLGVRAFDCEGRVQRVEFRDFVLINAYFPNSRHDHTRLDYKLAFCRAILRVANRYRAAGRHVLLCGDFNISHRPIDLANPKQNQKNAGFLPEERAWMDRFLGRHGWVDTFRRHNEQPGHYTFWSNMPGVRARNVGWRLDYFASNPELCERIARVRHQTDVFGSDHCPVELSLRA